MGGVADHECGFLTGGLVIGSDRPAPLAQVSLADKRKLIKKLLKKTSTEIEVLNVSLIRQSFSWTIELMQSHQNRFALVMGKEGTCEGRKATWF